jgi:hypothetical protein
LLLELFETLFNPPIELLKPGSSRSQFEAAFGEPNATRSRSDRRRLRLRPRRHQIRQPASSVRDLARRRPDAFFE